MWYMWYMWFEYIKYLNRLFRPDMAKYGTMNVVWRVHKGIDEQIMEMKKN